MDMPAMHTALLRELSNLNAKIDRLDERIEQRAEAADKRLDRIERLLDAQGARVLDLERGAARLNVAVAIGAAVGLTGLGAVVKLLVG
jgi:predicted  nucleic acid-binding Zn-ribbon protein